MQYSAIQQLLGILLVFFSSSLIPPLGVSLWYDDGAHAPFLLTYLVTLVTGLVVWLPVRKQRKDLRVREGFVIVVMFWVVLAACGAIPLMLAENPHMGVTDAFFESMSGLTTTGGTVLTGIDYLPESIRYYRQQLQWLGGMGIIVLAVAVMPMLGIGGMQLYRAETPGPMKNNKLTPRISETAKALWYIYLGLTVLCAFCYWMAGMSPFDAIGQSFATIATGGFSTHDRSIGYFQSPAVDVVAMVFMLLAGVNFSLHFIAFRSRRLSVYLRDAEVRTYLLLFGACGVICVGMLTAAQSFDTPEETVRAGLFHVISIGTTTGFTTSGYHWWPSFLPVMVLILSSLGGCAGSTVGGIKIVRALLLYRQGRREIVRLVHPYALMPIKLGGRPVSDQVINAVWGFFSLYVLSMLVLTLAVAATGLDIVTSFAAVAATINNLGAGIGEVAENYRDLPDAAKWILSAAMLLGRLELFTLLVLFTPTFWRG